MRRGVLRGARSERDSDRRRQSGQADSAAIGACLICPDDHSDVSYVKGFRGSRHGKPVRVLEPERYGHTGQSRIYVTYTMLKSNGSEGGVFGGSI